jgi:hypothetical protein
VRQPEEKQRKQRKRKSKNQEPPSPSYLEEEFIAGSSKLDGMGVFSGAVPIQGLGEMDIQGPNEMHELPGMMYEGMPAGPSNIPESRRAEEEMDEEGGDWAVRVGTSPPPVWGKRRASQDADCTTDPKRSRPK